MFAIDYAEGATDDLRGLSAFDRRMILDGIDEQLVHQPTTRTRNKKMLPEITPPWDFHPPIWELRLCDHRVFYDVNNEELRVTVRAIRHKPPHTTTEEIL